jgi:hypothetical protein
MNDDTVVEFPSIAFDDETERQVRLSEEFRHKIFTEIVDVSNTDEVYALSAFCAEFVTMFAHDTGLSKKDFLELFSSMYDEAAIIIEKNS